VGTASQKQSLTAKNIQIAEAHSFFSFESMIFAIGVCGQYLSKLRLQPAAR